MGSLGPTVIQCSLQHWRLLCEASSFRFGEALHPGPSFSIGAFNPTGLGSKHGVVAHLDPGVYAVTETHLTSRGIQDFKTGLKFAGAPFHLLHGQAAPPRQRSPVTGSYTGAGFVSSFPGRVVAQAWPAEVYQTARVQVAAFLIEDVWVLGGVCYGFATDKGRTQSILDAVVDRVLAQASGPRFVAGDWNLEIHELPQARRLLDRGFVEIQDLRAARFGIAPECTCKNATRKDFVWISPELQPAFVGASVDPSFWPDHALLAAQFRLPRASVPFFSWRRPTRRPGRPDLGQATSCHTFQGDSTQVFRDICAAYEDMWSKAEQARGLPPLARSERGRGELQQVRCKKVSCVPHRKSRNGDVEPLFFGSHAQHAHWFRQVRRLQALKQALHSPSFRPSALEHRGRLWESVIKAPGFPGGFSQWWLTRAERLQGDPVVVPLACPPAPVAGQFFLSFQANFRAFERGLLGHRRAAAVERRVHNPSLIFKDLRLPGKAPVESLVETRSVEVADVIQDEEAIETAATVEWQPDLPFTCNGLPIHVLHVTDDKLWVSDTASIVPGMQVEQKRLVGSLLEIFAEFGQEWGKRWMRREGVDAEQWRHLAEAFRAFVPFPELALEPITPARWRRALLEKSPHCAAGPDNLTRDDLLSFPACLTAQLLGLIHEAEASGVWPQQLLDGIISSLEKVPGACTVSQYRPICVLSLVYRVWASIRAKEALAHLARHAPPGLLGNLPGFSASDAWYALLLQIEESHLSGTHLFGLSADLIKAYNTLPRLPVAAFAKVCGIPDGILTPWLSALCQLRRHFKVRGSVGPPILSSTGFAEGDPLSCLAMAVVNIAYHFNFAHTPGTGQALSYVDNWHAVGKSVDELRASHQAICDFARAWDLPIDVQKTVVWSTHSSGRRQLRDAGFQVTLDFRELGAHLRSSQRATNFTQTARFQALEPKWPLLRASLAPIDQKIRALSSAAWPAAFHAVSAVSIGNCHFVKLRSSALLGLGLRAPGANPMVQLSLTGHPISDPEFFALQSTFRDAKFLAGPSVMGPLLDRASAAEGPAKGPAALLLARANAVGIEWDSVAVCFRDTWGPFQLWECSWPEVLDRLARMWQYRVLHQLGGRPTFEGLVSCDVLLTRAAFKSFPKPAQGLLRVALNGTFFTCDALCHAGQADSPACPHCGARDSIRHRVLDCPHFQEARGHSPLGRDQLERLAPAQLLHCWAPASPETDRVRTLLANVGIHLDTFQPFPDWQEYHLFVDGSCLRPETPALRLAAWAVTIAPVECPSTFLPLADGLVPGLLQSAFRAELCAMLSALFFAARVGRRVWIWSDCLGVVSRVRRWLLGSWVPTQRTRHFDLWSHVLPLLDRVQPLVRVCKVSAHLEPSLEPSVGDEWCAFHNNAVDRAAANAQLLRGDVFWGHWQRLCLHWDRELNIAKEVMALHVRIGHRSIITKQPLVFRPLPTEPLPPSPGSLGRFTARRGHRILQRYGATAVDRLDQWSICLECSQEPIRWISTVQLFLGYTFSFGPPQIMRAGCWTDLSSIPNGALVQCNFGTRVRFFARQLREFAAVTDSSWQGRECRPHSVALHIKLTCYPVRWSSELHERVDRYLTCHLPGGVASGNSRSWRSIPLP